MSASTGRSLEADRLQSPPPKAAAKPIKDCRPVRRCNSLHTAWQRQWNQLAKKRHCLLTMAPGQHIGRAFGEDFMHSTLCPIIRKNGHRFYGGKLPFLEISCIFWGALCLDPRHTARLSELYAVDVYAISIYSIVNVKAADRCRTA